MRLQKSAVLSGTKSGTTLAQILESCARRHNATRAVRFWYNAGMADLTPRQQTFVTEYLKDYNVTQAAIRSGFSPKSARTQGARQLQIDAVAEAVRVGQAEITERNKVDVDRIIAEYTKIAFADLTDYVNIVGGEVVVKDTAMLTRDQTAAIAEIVQTKDGIRIKLHDKGKANDALGKHLGMFVERWKDETPPDETPAQINVFFGPEPEGE